MTDDTEQKTEDAVKAPMYFRGAYDEAFEMLVEARNYVENDVEAFKYSNNPPDPVAMTQETLRLTSRLTQVMAWLMAQRAVHEGEIGADEFIKDKYRLEGQRVCLKRAIDEMKNGRCRMHGGTSPGAPFGNSNALKHGLYMAKAIAERREVAALIREMKCLAERMDEQE